MLRSSCYYGYYIRHGVEKLTVTIRGEVLSFDTLREARSAIRDAIKTDSAMPSGRWAV